MNKNFTPAFVFFLISGMATAQTVQVPNTFQAGTPARASEVNENFGAVEVAIDENAVDITANTTAIADMQASIDALLSSIVKVKANGQSIGTFLDATSPDLFNNGSFWVMSDMEYVFLVHAETSMLFGTVTEGHLAGRVGMMEDVWYDDVGCMGQSYVGISNIPPYNERVPLLRQGYVFASPDSVDPVRAYYSPAGSAPLSSLVMASSRHGGGIGDTCTDGMSFDTEFIQVLPNDVAITGVPNGPFSAPITLGH